jgi:glycosyltransferase involved in cell wall biosynthesis
MRDDLRSDFGISPQRISVIPFGVNDAIPTTELARADARQFFGLSEQEQVLLFFGLIAPYKGLKHLVAALPMALRANPRLRLVIAGKVKEGHGDYWNHIQHDLRDPALAAHLIMRIEHIPDDDIEPYFKAADVLVMPYEDIYQSGVLLLAYSFGLPVIATDVGALREDIVEGRTGLICRAKDPADIARAIESFFSGPLHANRERVQADIKAYVNVRNSWAKVAAVTESVYAQTLS